MDGSVNLAVPEFNAFLKRVADPLSAEGLQEAARLINEASARFERQGTRFSERKADPRQVRVSTDLTATITNVLAKLPQDLVLGLPNGRFSGNHMPI